MSASPRRARFACADADVEFQSSTMVMPPAGKAPPLEARSRSGYPPPPCSNRNGTAIVSPNSGTFGQFLSGATALRTMQTPMARDRSPQRAISACPPQRRPMSPSPSAMPGSPQRQTSTSCLSPSTTARGNASPVFAFFAASHPAGPFLPHAANSTSSPSCMGMRQCSYTTAVSPRLSSRSPHHQSGSLENYMTSALRPSPLASQCHSPGVPTLVGCGCGGGGGDRTIPVLHLDLQQYPPPPPPSVPPPPPPPIVPPPQVAPSFTNGRKQDSRGPLLPRTLRRDQSPPVAQQKFKRFSGQNGPVMWHRSGTFPTSRAGSCASFSSNSVGGSFVSASGVKGKASSRHCGGNTHHVANADSFSNKSSPKTGASGFRCTISAAGISTARGVLGCTRGLNNVGGSINSASRSGLPSGKTSRDSCGPAAKGSLSYAPASSRHAPPDQSFLRSASAGAEAMRREDGKMPSLERRELGESTFAL
eukprot:TRINITY_DN7845_c0_g1_i2.p1 TRINITY_DN7845_c0_g1~~TRINITY_DN7845_c0_g1_i2.p1  ORF type:complete len:554 (-),score=53.24 TRINITY_DN7845_c0_g1_i2:238-1668(-)